MKMTHLSLIVLGLGIALVALSYIWPHVTGGLFWDDQQAQEHAAAGAKVHHLSHSRAHSAAHGDDGHQEPEPGALEAAREQFEQTQADLRRARSNRQGTATLLKWTGAACSLLGGIGYFALRAAAR